MPIGKFYMYRSHHVTLQHPAICNLASFSSLKRKLQILLYVLIDAQKIGPAIRQHFYPYTFDLLFSDHVTSGIQYILTIN